MAFLAIFELGSLLCGVATSSNMLIVGRAVAGIGAAGLMNGALTIVAACVPMANRPTYLGIMISTSQTGIVLGPLIGGALTQYTTWRWCFYINLPIGGVVAFLFFLIQIPNRTVEDADKWKIRSTLDKLDFLGFVLFAPAAIQVLLALQWGGIRYQWSSSTIIGLFCGSFGTFCLFLVWEYRKGDQAMIPWPMIRQRIVWTGNLVNLFAFGSQWIVSYYLPIYFQAIKGATPTLSGVYLLPTIVSQITLTTIGGILSKS